MPVKLTSLGTGVGWVSFFFNGFGGLGVACWPLVPKFAGSNPAETIGFLRANKVHVVDLRHVKDP